MDIEREKHLLQQARTDDKAFEELYLYYYPVILNYLIRRTLDVALASDLTSITFIKAYQRASGFNWRGIRFSAWLYRVAHNEMVSHYRHHKRLTSLDQLLTSQQLDIPANSNIEAELIAADEELERHQLFQQVQTNILQLSPKYQEVLHLRYFENLSIKEICHITGKGEGTVKSLLSRAVAQLRSISANQTTAVQPSANSSVSLLKD